MRFAAVLGPGLLVMLADTDAGNVVTGAAAGAQWGFRLLPLLLLLIPALYMVQELTVRLGIFAGRGHAELIREKFGPGWAWASVMALAVASAGSLITEFTGVAGIGELYGIPKAASLAVAVAVLILAVTSGSHRRIERTAIAIGAFELAFFVVAWSALRGDAPIIRDLGDFPFSDRAFLYMSAAIVGAVFNPWMIFYQQSAVVQKRLRPADLGLARWDTACGAVMTQLLTAAILVTAATRLRAPGGLTSVGEISAALASVLGSTVGRLVFSLGVLGAAMVAAVVASLALAYGLREMVVRTHATSEDPFAEWSARGAYAVLLIASAGLVWAMPNLVQLNVAAQVLNAFLLPLVLGLLLALALTVLPTSARPRGCTLAAVLGGTAAVCACGLIGGVGGMF